MVNGVKDRGINPKSVHPPPVNLMAEEGTLGAMILDNATIAPIRAILRPADFDHADNRALFATIAAMVDDGLPVDALTLDDRIGRVKLRTPDGGDLIEAVIRATPHTANALHHAGIVLKNAQSRDTLAELATGIDALSAGDVTATNVIASVTTRLEAIRDRGDSTRIGRMTLVTGADNVEPKKIVWLWQHRIPKRFITIFAGQTGLGKSYVTLDVIARMTRGDAQPGAEGDRFEPGGALIISEDSQEYMLAPRLDALGADRSKVYFMTWEAMGFFTLSNADFLARAWDESGRPALIVIDPPTNFLGGLDEHRNGDVRAAIKNLITWLESLDEEVAIVMITHVNKSNGTNVDASARIIGSVAWVTSCRSAQIFTRDPDDPTRCLIVPPKENVGPHVDGLAYRVVPVGDMATVEWLGETTTTANEAMQGDAKQPRGVRAVEWLMERFKEKPAWPSGELKQLAKNAGISKNALFEDEVNAIVIRKNSGPGTEWVWRLKDHVLPDEWGDPPP